MKEEIKTYFDVVNNGLMLPKKDKYTVSDYKKLRKEYAPVQAAFIVKCSATYWNTDWSKVFDKSNEEIALMEMCGQI